MKFTSKIALTIFCLIIFIIYYTISYTRIQVQNTKTNNYHNEILQIENGWGFNLYKNKKVIIRQKNIPAINGKHPFKSRVDAEKIADLMSFKIENEIFPPSISLREMDSLNINY